MWSGLIVDKSRVISAFVSYPYKLGLKCLMLKLFFSIFQSDTEKVNERENVSVLERDLAISQGLLRLREREFNAEKGCCSTMDVFKVLTLKL